MTTTRRPFAHWTLTELTAAITSDEGVLAKEGDRCLCVDRDELAAHKAERTFRWTNPTVRPLPVWVAERIGA